jgi:thermostable 8-oxoguanine DNA glycosylase
MASKECGVPVFILPFKGKKIGIKCAIYDFQDKYLRRPVRSGINSAAADRIARCAGSRIRKGERTKKNLDKIFLWKHESSPYYKSLKRSFDFNSEECVETVLTRVAKSATDAEAVIELTRLKGVDVRTASAMLANIYPGRFTVMDIHALRALGINNNEKVALYLIYNQICSHIAQKCGVSLRTLDRALWEWGKTHRPKRNQRNIKPPA